MSLNFKRLLIVPIWLLACSISFALPSRILIIRHAEKPEIPSENLSPRGYERAQALTELFEKHRELATTGLPSAYFAAAFIPGKSSRRSVETLTPLSQKYQLPLQCPYLGKEFQQLAEKILNDRQLDSKTVMIAWTSESIYDLAQALGAQPTHRWEQGVFNKIWVLDFNINSQIQFYEVSQLLLPGDQ